MNIHELQPGDIIAVRGKGFLPRAIQFFMKLWSKIHYKKKQKKYYNHTALYLGGGVTVEAIATGAELTRATNYSGKDVVIFRLKEPLDDQQKGNIYADAISIVQDQVKYEFLNFAWWALYILSNGKKDKSPKGDKVDDRVFCFELSCTVLNKSVPLWLNPGIINTVDLQEDERFNQFYLD